MADQFETQDTLAREALQRLCQGVDSARKNDIWGGLQELLRLRHMDLEDPFYVLEKLIEMMCAPRNAMMNLGVKTTISEVCMRLSRACFVVNTREGFVFDLSTKDQLKTNLEDLINIVDETKHPGNGLRYRLECVLAGALSLPSLDFGTARSNLQAIQRFLANQTLLRGAAGVVEMAVAGAANPGAIAEVLRAVGEIANIIQDSRKKHYYLTVLQIEALAEVCLSSKATQKEVKQTWSQLKDLLQATKRTNWLIVYAGVCALQKITAEERSLLRKEAWELLQSYERFKQLGLLGLSSANWRIREKVLEAYIILHYSFASPTSTNTSSLQIATEAEVLLKNRNARDHRLLLLTNHRSDVEDILSNLDQNWPRQRGEVERMLDNHLAVVAQLVNGLRDQMRNLLPPNPPQGPPQGDVVAQPQLLQDDVEVLCNSNTTLAERCVRLRKIAILHLPNDEINREICDQLCRGLLLSLENDKTENDKAAVQSAAAWAIANIASTSPILLAQVMAGADGIKLRQSLMSLLVTPDDTVKSSAAWAIANIASSFPALMAGDDGVRLRQNFLSLLETGDAKFKSIAAWALANIAFFNPALLAQVMAGEDGIKLRKNLLSLLVTTDDTVKSFAAWAIANIASTSPTLLAQVMAGADGIKLRQSLMSLLVTPDDTVKSFAAWALANIASSFPALIDGNELGTNLVVLLQNSNPSVINMAAWAIANIASSHPELIKGDTNKKLCENLATLLHDQEDTVKGNAAWTIANIASSNDGFARDIANEVDLLKNLLSMLSSANAVVKSNATWAIANISSKNEEFAKALHENNEDVQLCKSLASFLEHHDPAIGSNAAWAIAKIAASNQQFAHAMNDTLSRQNLVKLLVRGDRGDRTNAAWAIGSIALWTTDFTAGVDEQDRAKLCDGLMTLLLCADAGSQNIAAWTIANLASHDENFAQHINSDQVKQGLVMLLETGDEAAKNNSVKAIAKIAAQNPGSTFPVTPEKKDSLRQILEVVEKNGDEDVQENVRAAKPSLGLS